MLRLPERERGSALLLLLLVAVVLQLLAAALLANALTESRIALQHELGVRLHYIAEAGLEQALAVKKVDFGFTGELDSVPCGGGCYSVVITPDPEEPGLRHRIDSTGELSGRRLTLGVLVEQRSLFGEAVLLADDLSIAGAVINGALHCNSRLHIGGPGNRVLPGGGLSGELTYSCAPERISWATGGIIEVRGEAYSEKSPFPESWRRDPLPRPQINLAQLTEGDHFIRKSGSKEWREAPEYGLVWPEDGQESYYLHIENGDLTICPGAEQHFDFAGILIVDGDVRIGGSGTIDLEGLIFAGGTLAVTSGVNAAAEDKAVVLAADSDLQVFATETDCTENPVFGGELLLFSRGGAVTIGHQKMKGEQFAMHGIIFAQKIAVCNCELTPLSGNGERWSGYFPAYGLVVTEWLQP